MHRLLLCLAAVLVAVTAGCAREPARDVVLARVGVEARPALAEPPQTAKPRRFGTHTRNAVPATRDGFEVEVPAHATRLAFSVAGGKAGVAARFEVSQRSAPDAAWQPFIEVESNEAAWRDHEFALSAGAARSLRFSAQAEQSEALWGSILLLGAADASVARPDILLVSLDTLGAGYLGAFSGRDDVSPHLDAFFGESAFFRRAYAQYGNTLVSHASLFSGLYPRHLGFQPDKMAQLPSSLVEALAADGYRTVAFTEGGYVSSAFGFARGFDAYDNGTLGLAGTGEAGASDTFEHAAAWLERNPRDRAFVFAHTYEVHAPYLPRDDAARAVAARTTPHDARVFSAEEQSRQSVIQMRAGLPQADFARLAALYLAEIHTLDAEVGRLLARLAALARADRTLVVITADHGEQFGEWGRMAHGQSLHNKVLHVPLALRWPGVIRPAVIDTPVPLVDLMPTLFELAGIPLPASLDGRSLLPLLEGKAEASRPVFSEQGHDDAECARAGVPECPPLDRVAVQSGRFKLVTSDVPAWTRLYDLENDPREEQDVSLTFPDETQRLSALVEAYRGKAGATTDPEAAGTQDVDADTLERLRELGYLD
ncbi:MAG TPA: sulfatase [Myxococcota bacterium]|nr:sulfatase [Myxococcota bacterium]